VASAAELLAGIVASPRARVAIDVLLAAWGEYPVNGSAAKPGITEDQPLDELAYDRWALPPVGCQDSGPQDEASDP
jgi:hypothetical protein